MMASAKAPQELTVLLDGAIIGTVQQLKTGQYTFTYAETWRQASNAYPLSLSMPLARPMHDDAKIRAYMWGLLPDNDHVLATWGKMYSVSDRNPFALLGHIGEDCPGAVQFATSERVGTLQVDATAEVDSFANVDWLSERELAERLREIQVSGGAATRRQSDMGQFSLPGAQNKIALFRDENNDQWGIPSGRTPTTYIIKPPLIEYPGFVENEYLCLALARRLQLSVATSEILHAEDEIAIAVKRYDRVQRGRRVFRLHQEDCCQALGVLPQNKYENQGGPGIHDVTQLLRQYSSRPQEDVSRFIDAVAFAWIIANSDAHAKNYSLLITGKRIRLAPFYDLESVLPYPEQIDFHKVKLAMKIGKEGGARRITSRHWQHLARNLHLPQEELRARLNTLVHQIPDAVSDTWRIAKSHGITHPVVDSLQEAILQRAKDCASLLERPWTDTDPPL